MKKKKLFFRIKKKAKNRFLVEERHTFMFFWRFYVKGSIKLKIPKYFASRKSAEDYISKKAREKGYEAFIVSLQ